MFPQSAVLAVICFMCTVCAGSGFAEAVQYTVSNATRFSSKPIIERNAENTWSYNYNPAVIPHYAADKTALLVRVQNTTGARFGVTPSSLTFTSSFDGIDFSPINASSVVLDSAIAYNATITNKTKIKNLAATEDPRVACKVDPATGLCSFWYLLYSAVVFEAPNWLVRLSMATSATPGVEGSWVNYGQLFPDDPATGYQWTKSGAMLIRDAPPHYLFFGDSSYVPGLQYATSDDLYNWTIQPGVWLPVRKDRFDSKLVEGGAYPIRLPTGDYFMLYNSAREDGPTPEPGYTLQYNVGWVILNGSNPAQILQRSDAPILTPELSWETGMWNGSFFNENRSLTPRVVFCEGWELQSTGCGSVTVRLYYGATDSAIGIATVTVSYPSSADDVNCPKKKSYTLAAWLSPVVVVLLIIVVALIYKQRKARGEGSYHQINA